MKFYFVFPQVIFYNSNKYDKINDSCFFEWLICGPFRLCVYSMHKDDVTVCVFK